MKKRNDKEIHYEIESKLMRQYFQKINDYLKANNITFTFEDYLFKELGYAVNKEEYLKQVNQILFDGKKKIEKEYALRDTLDEDEFKELCNRAFLCTDNDYDTKRYGIKYYLINNERTMDELNYDTWFEQEIQKRFPSMPLEKVFKYWNKDALKDDFNKKWNIVPVEQGLENFIKEFYKDKPNFQEDVKQITTYWNLFKSTIINLWREKQVNYQRDNLWRVGKPRYLIFGDAITCNVESLYDILLYHDPLWNYFKKYGATWDLKVKEEFENNYLKNSSMIWTYLSYGTQDYDKATKLMGLSKITQNRGKSK